jgi:hypothetical protein
MITKQSAERLKELLETVEKALKGADRLTKKLIVETLASEGECSRGSTGFEKSFLKALKAKNIPLTVKFAEAMGEPHPQSVAAAPSSRPIQESDKPEQTMQTLVNLKGVSLLRVDSKGDAKVTFVGGGEQQIGKFDESAFRSSSTLLEFNSASS